MYKTIVPVILLIVVAAFPSGSQPAIARDAMPSFAFTVELSCDVAVDERYDVISIGCETDADITDEFDLEIDTKCTVYIVDREPVSMWCKLGG